MQRVKAEKYACDSRRYQYHTLILQNIVRSCFLACQFKKSYYQKYGHIRIDCVKKSVCQVMPERIETPHSIIKGMRYPGQWMPVACVKIKKCPLEKRAV